MSITSFPFIPSIIYDGVWFAKNLLIVDSYIKGNDWRCFPDYDGWNSRLYCCMAGIAKSSLGGEQELPLIPVVIY